jgi:hypothetical protein
MEDIDRLINLINKYTRAKYGTDHAYGGYRLVSYVGDKGGERDISVRMRKGEYYWMLSAIEALLSNEQYNLHDLKKRKHKHVDLSQ